MRVDPPSGWIPQISLAKMADLTEAKVSPYAKIAAMLIYREAKLVKSQFELRPKRSALAAVGITRQTYLRALKELEVIGFVSVNWGQRATTVTLQGTLKPKDRDPVTKLADDHSRGLKKGDIQTREFY